MLIKKVRLLDKDGLFDIRITDGKFEAIAEEIQAKEGEEIIEGNGALASAPFIEPHIHLDTTLTAGEPEWNKSGTLFEGIERWSQRKEFLTKEDVKNRAKKAIEWQVANGIQFIRTHVDVTDESLVALKAMVEAHQNAEDMTDDQVAEMKAAKEKLMESAQKLFTKMYEQNAAAGAQAGPTPGAGPAPESSANDDVVDGDYRDV